MRFEYPPGATPLDPDEAKGLRASWVVTQSELNAIEQQNIIQAQVWLARTRRIDPLSEKFLRDLHRKMFGDVWRWAGEPRRSDKNIGVDWRQIPVQLRQHLDDVRYWIANGTFELDEVATRFHHRLVAIHCFANGNGRHARLATDALLATHGYKPFSWGSANLVVANETRQRYIRALRQADAHSIDALLRFVRS